MTARLTVNRALLESLAESARITEATLPVLVAQNREALEQRKADQATIARLTSIIASQERTEERLRRFIGKMLRARRAEADSERMASEWHGADVSDKPYRPYVIQLRGANMSGMEP